MPRLRLYSSFLLLLRHVASQKTDVDNSNEVTPFNPSMGIVIVTIILVILFFALVLVSIYMRRREEQARGIVSVDPGILPNVRRQTTRGLDASVIETFPTFRYSTEKTLMICKEALECPICLDEFKEGDMLRLIPQCCHAFHLSCIDAWLHSHATCPLCRTNLVHVLGESISLDIPNCPLCRVYLVPVPGESASYDIPGLAKEAGQNSRRTSIDDNIQQTEHTGQIGLCLLVGN